MDLNVTFYLPVEQKSIEKESNCVDIKECGSFTQKQAAALLLLL